MYFPWRGSHLTNIDEGSKTDIVINAREHLCDGRRVADHAARAHDLGQVTTWNNRRRLIVDSTLESRGAPIHELDRAFRFDSRDSRIDIFWYDVATVHHATGHVLPMARVAFHEH